MSVGINGGDPCTYKKIRDDNNTDSNYDNHLSTNVSELNVTRTPNTYIFSTHTQQLNSSTAFNYSSSSTTNESASDNRSSNDHSKTS
ncbi:unnamed protein product [Rotaria sp. Silwood1]|nr:unnamed protein product [Rotaria sp. Silwood1]CAF1143538.1 unnamed protein product [Rotaria sp. Silwood1]CAF3429112.1 unnamed protein product [Rotaria sp. Silwood1]CAF4613724.1 unnamed protein product [Rotaria sp. Silwood1]